MYALFKFTLTLLIICWGLYILAYGVGVATTHPVTMLGRMIATVGRGFLWGCVGVFKVLALVLTTLSDGLRKLLS
jgi:hypothetical protein